MNKVYNDFDDVHVRSTIVYNDGDSEYVFYDENCTEKISKDEMISLFKKGMLVHISSDEDSTYDLLVPYELTVTKYHCSIKLGDGLKNLYSTEYSGTPS